MNYMIAVDWGTTHLRAYLCQLSKENDLVLLETQFGKGVMKCNNNFEQVLFGCIDDWLNKYGRMPIQMIGTIGSSIGWRETHYLPCPVLPSHISNAILQFECRGFQISIIPGISCMMDAENYDVMRGEELQILGWLNLNTENKKGKRLVCLPGTHTKWVLIDNGKIILFKTAMTGELFELLNNHSILVQSPNTDFAEEAFEKGAKYTLQSELGNFSHSLFSVRSNQLFGKLAKQDASSYLSGLLIGNDVRAAINTTEWEIKSFDEIVVIGSKSLTNLFSRVLTMQGIKSVQHDSTQATLFGFLKLSQLRM